MKVEIDIDSTAFFRLLKFAIDDVPARADAVTTAEHIVEMIRAEYAYLALRAR